MEPVVPLSVAAAASRPARRALLVWRSVFGACIVAIALLAWLPGHAVPSPNWSDKVSHLLGFAALGLLSWRAFPQHRGAAFVALLGFGALIELVQWQLPTRSAEWADLVADALGLMIGAAAGVLTGSLWARRT